MKNFGMICGALVICASLVASASASDRVASVSKSTLGTMGLGGMQQLADNDGLAIRGKGTSASVWGEGTANFLGQKSVNGYTADASHHSSSSSAAGGNLSFAGVAHISTGHHGSLNVNAVLGVAGGTSFATAH